VPNYLYVAVSADRQRVRGTLEAAGERAALAELERRKLTPVSIAEKAAVSPRGVQISGALLARAYGQLGDLLRAGVPLLRSLRLLAGRRSARKLGAVFGELADSVEDGEELADAMAKHPTVFKETHLAIVRAGERGAFLEQALARLAALVQRQVELRQKVVGSLVYPSFILVFGSIILVAIFAIFVPQFRPIYADLPLKAPTRIVFAISELLTTHRLLLGGMVVVTIAGAWWVLRQRAFRARAADLSAKLPGVGLVIRTLAVARVCRVLGTLLGNGVPMLTSLAIAREAAGLPVLGEAIGKATEAVRAGASLAEPLEASGLVPDDVAEMIGVAEAANNLEEVLPTIAETLEQRVDRALTTLVKLIEPATMLLLGGAIVFIAVALIMPMLQLISQV
jgi:general secretion pathway protein F